MTACLCGKPKPARLGGGWKEHAGRLWCPKCWHAAFIMRCVTLPVAGPVDAEWTDLRAALKTCWTMSTQLANWTMRELRTKDFVRTPAMTKIPKMPTLYLYPAARETVPGMDSASVVAVLHAVEGTYREKRFEMLWYNRTSLPTYKYPVPYPVHNAGWTVEGDADGGLFVNARLAGTRFKLRLRGGREFGRQIAVVRQLIDGTALQGELSFYQTSARKSDHRPSATETGPATRLMAKMAVWVPRPAKKERSGVLILKTLPDSLLTWTIAGSDRVEHFHADHARRWVAEHRRRLDRTNDDTKREKRIPKRTLEQFGERRRWWVTKHRDRMKTLTHEASAMIAGICDRRKIAEVQYDDTCHDYITEFPWHELKSKLQYKLTGLGVTFTTTPNEPEAA